jgi:hypothetical protein
LGVTVHFEGRLRGEQAFADLLRRVEEIAKAKTWLTEKFRTMKLHYCGFEGTRRSGTIRDRRKESSFTCMRIAIPFALNSIATSTFRNS